MSLKNLEKKIKDCKECGLCKNRLNIVFGEGFENAKIVFLGEAPGKKEDQEGRPFVGASGSFLSEMLKSINLKREDIFITNIVKCRPPNNRDPKPSEVEICSELYLWRQLSYIKPDLIVTLGRYAMHCFLPKDVKISKEHGRLKKIKNKSTGEEFNLLPLYHPAAALYNGALRKTLEKDFKKILKILK